MSETLGLSETANAKFLVSSLVPEIFGLTILPLFQCYRDNESLMSALQTSDIVIVLGWWKIAAGTFVEQNRDVYNEIGGSTWNIPIEEWINNLSLS